MAINFIMVVKEKMIILYNTALWGRGDRGSVVDGGVDVGVGVTVMGEWEGEAVGEWGLSVEGGPMVTG